MSDPVSVNDQHAIMYHLTAISRHIILSNQFEIICNSALSNSATVTYHCLEQGILLKSELER